MEKTDNEKTDMWRKILTYNFFINITKLKTLVQCVKKKGKNVNIVNKQNNINYSNIIVKNKSKN